MHSTGPRDPQRDKQDPATELPATARDGRAGRLRERQARMLAAEGHPSRCDGGGEAGQVPEHRPEQPPSSQVRTDAEGREDDAAHSPRPGRRHGFRGRRVTTRGRGTWRRAARRGRRGSRRGLQGPRPHPEASRFPWVQRPTEDDLPPRSRAFATCTESSLYLPLRR